MNNKLITITILCISFLYSGNALAANSSIFTIEAWVRPATSIATKAVVAKAEEMRMVTDASGNPTCQIMSSSAWQTAEVSSLAIAVDTWSHIACSYDKVSLKVFVNGVEKGSTALTVAVDDTAADLKLGTDDSSDAVYGEFEGKIDDVRFYNYARSAKQITQDLNAGHPAVGSPVGSQVGYWKFDEGYGDTANDSSPYDNDGDLAGDCPGAATCPSWTNSGKFGKALSFDGGDYVDMGNVSELNFERTDAFSGGAWIKSSNSDGYIISKIDQTLPVSNGWGFRTSSNVLYLFLISDYGALNYIQIVGSTNVNDDNWHHVSFTYDGSSSASGVKFYVDGVLESVTTSNDGLTATMQTSISFNIGSRDDGSDAFFTGIIDEVKIYNYALTEDEVRVEYNQGKAIVLGATGTESDGTPSFSANREYCVPGDIGTCNPPVAEWNFNEQTGSSAYDTSANNNTGTITNATWTPSGKYGSALSFDCDGDYVNCGSHSSLNLTTAITIEAWVKPKSGNSNILIKGDSFSHPIPYQFYLNPTNYLRFYQSQGGSFQTSVSGTIQLSNNQWYFVVAVNDGTSARIYVNGILGGEDTSPATSPTQDNESLTIGADIDGDNPFNGTIDGVKIYDYARTPAQVAWSYNRGKPVAHWRFDECQGNTAHDESGNSNTGTITIGANGTQDDLGTCETPVDGTGAWYNAATGKSNSAMSFDGDDDWVDVGDTSYTDVRVLSFWAKANDTTEEFIELSASASVKVESGVVTVAGFGTATVYVDGVATTSFPDTNWHHIVVVSDTDITADTVKIGRVVATYYNGLIDEVKIYNYALTAAQVRLDYNSAAVNFR